MAKAKKVVTLVEAEAATMDLLEEAVETAGNPAVMDKEEIPKTRGDRNWTRFIMSKFEEDEVFDGRPKVEGMRRLVEKYVGKIIQNTSVVNQSPAYTNGMHACVTSTIAVRLWSDGTMKVVSGVSDVFRGNGSDELFSYRYSSSCSETRSRGRALKELLELTGVVSNEEVSEVAVEDCGVAGRLTDSQVVTLDNMCRRLNIQPYKFLEVEDVYLMDYDQALRALEKLNGFYNRVAEIPSSLKGYVPINKKARK